MGDIGREWRAAIGPVLTPRHTRADVREFDVFEEEVRQPGRRCAVCRGGSACPGRVLSRRCAQGRAERRPARPAGQPGRRWRLGPYADSTNAGNDIWHQYSTGVQKRKTLWWSLQRDGGSVYWTIKNTVGSGMCAEAAKPEVDAVIELQPCDGSRGQQWLLSNDPATTPTA